MIRVRQKQNLLPRNHVSWAIKIPAVLEGFSLIGVLLALLLLSTIGLLCSHFLFRLEHATLKKKFTHSHLREQAWAEMNGEKSSNQTKTHIQTQNQLRLRVITQEGSRAFWVVLPPGTSFVAKEH